METSSFRNKKTVYLIILIISVILVGILIYSILKPKPFLEQPRQPIEKKEKTLEETLQDLTVPPEKGVYPISEKVIKDLTAPIKETPQVPEDIIQNLTVPEY